MSRQVCKNTHAFYEHTARKYNLHPLKVLPNFKREEQKKELDKMQDVRRVEQLPSLRMPSDTQWALIERSIYARRERLCPICFGNFGGRPQLVTSCRHTFHEQCYRSYIARCPAQANKCVVCRQDCVAVESPNLRHHNYKLTVIYVQSFARRRRAVLRRDALRCVRSGRFGQDAAEFGKAAEAARQTLDMRFGAEVHRYMQAAAEADRLFDQFLALQNQTVFQGIERARRRHCECCYICYDDLPPYHYIQFCEGAGPDHYVMSCCGCIFHRSCLEGAEMNRTDRCCYCKQGYFKIPVLLVRYT